MNLNEQNVFIDIEAQIDKFSTKLKEWDKQIDEYESAVEKAEGDIRQKLQKSLNELEEYRNSLQAQLMKLKDAGDQAADDLQDGIGKSFSELKAAYKKAKSHFD